MKILTIAFLSIFLLSRTVCAQTVTNVTVTCTILLSNGTAFTNSVSNGNIKILTAATNAWTKFNLAQLQRDPQGVQTTNLSHFFIEFSKAEFLRYKQQYDDQVGFDVAAKLPGLTDAQKDQIRAILGP